MQEYYPEETEDEDYVRHHAAGDQSLAEEICESRYYRHS
jgi:hypothetical protein